MTNQNSQAIDPKVFDRPIYYTAHRSEVPRILRRGQISSFASCPPIKRIWSPSITEKLNKKPVPGMPGLVMGALVGFTFTSRTPAKYNLATGHKGVSRIPNSEMCVLTTTPRRLCELAVPFLVTPLQPSHAQACLFGLWPGLAMVDYLLLDSGHFTNTPDDVLRVARAGAELCAVTPVPLSAIEECAVWDDAEGMEAKLSKILTNTRPKVVRRPDLFFRQGA